MPRGARSGVSAATRARDEWDRAVDVWEDFQEKGKDFARELVHGPSLLRAIGPVRGLEVLDVGCGQGRFTRRIARRGAKVTGIDWSPAMIEIARQHERDRPSGTDYRLLDARRLGITFPPGAFDLVVACMSFMDMPDLPKVLKGVHRVLKDGGRLVFSVSHPNNTAEVGWERAQDGSIRGVRIDRYFEPRVGVTEWEMARLTRPFRTTFWHRSLEEWFRTLHRAGFRVDDLFEPHPTGRAVRGHPTLEGTARVPFFLVLACRRDPSGGAPRRHGENEL